MLAVERPVPTILERHTLGQSNRKSEDLPKASSLIVAEAIVMSVLNHGQVAAAAGDSVSMDHADQQRASFASYHSDSTVVEVAGWDTAMAAVPELNRRRKKAAVWPAAAGAVGIVGCSICDMRPVAVVAAAVAAEQCRSSLHRQNDCLPWGRWLRYLDKDQMLVLGVVNCIRQGSADCRLWRAAPPTSDRNNGPR